MAFSFRGGIHPDDKKKYTADKNIEELKPPERVVIPVLMHVGAPCLPKVQVGERVRMGQEIASCDAPISAPVHASVAGRVTEIAPHPHPNGSEVLSVVIENDHTDELWPGILPREDAEAIPVEKLISIIREAGVVGLGGAAFPTHAKLRSGMGAVRTLIINAAECEPYITADARLLVERTAGVVEGINIIRRIYGLSRVVIGIEANKTEAARALKEILGKHSHITLKVLRTKYPQGSEKQLIQVITGRQVPTGGLPSDVGCAVFGVGTAYAVYDAVMNGMPLIKRVVTVSGSAVANPKNYEVRIGTPVSELFEAAGGFREQPYKIINGGPMMGAAQHTLDVSVIKATNALLAFSRDEDHFVDSPSCIRCGRCVRVCPMRLMPCLLHQYGVRDDLKECDRLGIRSCMECGACAYICPARIPLVQSLRASKQKLALASKQAKGGR